MLMVNAAVAPAVVALPGAVVGPVAVAVAVAIDVSKLFLLASMPACMLNFIAYHQYANA